MVLGEVPEVNEWVSKVLTEVFEVVSDVLMEVTEVNELV